MILQPEHIALRLELTLRLLTEGLSGEDLRQPRGRLLQRALADAEAIKNALSAPVAIRRSANRSGRPALRIITGGRSE